MTHKIFYNTEAKNVCCNRIKLLRLLDYTTLSHGGYSKWYSASFVDYLLKKQNLSVIYRCVKPFYFFPDVRSIRFRRYLSHLDRKFLIFFTSLKWRTRLSAYYRNNQCKIVQSLKNQNYNFFLDFCFMNGWFILIYTSAYFCNSSWLFNKIKNDSIKFCRFINIY